MAEQSKTIIAGNYSLRMQLGEQDLYLTPGSFVEISFIEDLNRALPSFSAVLKGPSSEILNSAYETAKFTLSNPTEGSKAEEKSMEFLIYRQFSQAFSFGVDTLKLTGLAKVEGLFSPSRSRGWVSTSVASILDQVRSDLGTVKVSKIDLALSKLVVNLSQPAWSNLQLLHYLVNSTQASGIYGYYSFFDFPAGPSSAAGGLRLNFRSIPSFCEDGVKVNFLNSKTPIKDMLPIYTLESIENGEFSAVFGIDKQRYQYYDYDEGQYKEDEIPLEDLGFQSLSKYIGYDRVRGTEGITSPRCPRMGPYINDPKLIEKGHYAKRVNGIKKLWLTTSGTTKLGPGNIVVILPAAGEDLEEQPNTGTWMVERVIHHISSTYFTKLLLTRAGADYAGVEKNKASAATFKPARSILPEGLVYA